MTIKLYVCSDNIVIGNVIFVKKCSVLLFQVLLAAHNQKHAQFKILPRFKVKSEGDMVSVKKNSF